MTTNQLQISNQALRSGVEYTFISDDHELIAYYNDDAFGGYCYNIWFNGTLVYNSRGFLPFQNKLQQLVTKYGLTQSFEA